LQQEHSTPSVGCTARCEVCGKRLRMSTPDGLLRDSSQASVAAVQSNTAAAGAGAVGTAAEAERSTRPVQTSVVSVIAGVLPASISAALQSVGSSGGSHTMPAQAAPAASQQQAQQFDAVAAAAADFNAAGSQSFLSQSSDQWVRWQGVVSAVRSAHSGQQQLSHGGGSSNSLLEAGIGESCSSSGPEVSRFHAKMHLSSALQGSHASALLCAHAACMCEVWKALQCVRHSLCTCALELCWESGQV
jgi:hypothetical protein